ncbi:3000_t:CDS:1, partial [Acaulospora colombiana]
RAGSSRKNKDMSNGVIHDSIRAMTTQYLAIMLANRGSTLKKLVNCVIMLRNVMGTNQQKQRPMNR